MSDAGMRALTEPYYAALRRGELVVQHCKACDRNIMYPRHVCPFCHEADLSWVPTSGTGDARRMPTGGSAASRNPSPRGAPTEDGSSNAAFEELTTTSPGASGGGFSLSGRPASSGMPTALK